MTKPVSIQGVLWDDLPVWYRAGVNDIGKKETGDNAGDYIVQIIKQAKCGHIHDPWCAIAVNAWCERNGIPGTLSPSSQSFRSDENFIALAGPALGAITVFWRNSKRSGLGHVGLYDGETATVVSVVSGNAGDMVARKTFAKSSAKFGLVGYYWPTRVPLPKIGALPLPRSASAGDKVV